MSVQTLDGARWSCRSCGMCCHASRLGPVEPEVIAGLRARGIEDLWPDAAESPWFHVEPDPTGAPSYWLTHREGRCVFLRPDRLCAVHALLGPEAKPGFCRTYPLHLVQTPTGSVAVVREDCGGLHESFQDGQPLAEQLDPASLPGAPPRQVWAPAQVQALPELQVATAAWQEWERSLQDLLAAQAEDPPSPEALVELLRERLYTLARAPMPEPDPMRYLVATRAVIEGLYRVLGAAADAPASVSAWERDFVRENLETLGRARARLATDWSALDLPLSRDARRYLALVLRSRLLGKQLQGPAGVAAGLGTWLVDVAIARAGQPEDDLQSLTLQPVGRALSRWRKLSMNAMIQQVYRMARPALVDAFLHASA